VSCGFAQDGLEPQFSQSLLPRGSSTAFQVVGRKEGREEMEGRREGGKKKGREGGRKGGGRKM
jgi:hypothetical protein